MICPNFQKNKILQEFLPCYTLIKRQKQFDTKSITDHTSLYNLIGYKFKKSFRLGESLMFTLPHNYYMNFIIDPDSLYEITQGINERKNLLVSVG